MGRNQKRSASMPQDPDNEMGNSSSGGDVTDVRKIRRLVELMNEYELSEMDLRDGDIRIRIRKGGDTIVTGPMPPAVAPAVPVAAAAAPSAPAAPVAAAAADSLPVIKSPMVGTFYTSSSPESPPLVKVGDHVGTETAVCIIEAMKVFNEIPAEIKGKIVAVLVENGSPVEYGQPLFRIDPKG
jgi:acetyl-CoA carboxylase biotin carboxyl carrier protein